MGEVITTGRGAAAVITTVRRTIRLPLLDLNSYSRDVQYSVIVIGAGGVNMSDDGGGGSKQECWTG